MGEEADADWQAGLAEWGAETVRTIKPHAYVPSAMHMGDCMICGHVQESIVHKQGRTTHKPRH
jgi:hypothetical protein